MTTNKTFGYKQERDVAFHLRRAFGTVKNVQMFHGLKFVANGETAQIDHLVLHRYGFVVVESKSIHGEVTVNEHQEWSRSFEGKWYGIPSPVRQAQNQIDILKVTLRENSQKLLGKIFGMQKQFGGRKYDLVVAVSSSAIIHREQMPTSLSDLVVKTEFLGERIKSIMDNYGGILSADAAFSEEELHAVADFLSQHQEITASPTGPTVTVALQSSTEQAGTDESWYATCRHCSNQDSLEARWGKFGYYVACTKCDKNTALKRPCPRCSGETRLKKCGSSFQVTCGSCGDVGEILVRDTRSEVVKP